LLLHGCRGEEQVPVEVDLTRLSVCRIGNDLAKVPAVSEGSSRKLLQSDESPIDFFLRLPAKSILFFELSPGVSQEAFEITVTSDEREEVLAPLQYTVGAWRAEMRGVDGEVVRLRFENRTEDPLAWGRPRIASMADIEDPVLPPKPRVKTDRPNILLYVVDALRADRLSAYGYERPTSPNLDKLAQRSVIFLNAYSTGANTLGSIPALFTSLPPAEAKGRLRPTKYAVEHTLAEVFQDAGYATAGFQANFLLKPFLGYARGFDTYDTYSEFIGGRENKPVEAQKLHERVLQWLSNPRSGPFFIYVQSLDVHSPYEPPFPFLGKFNGDQEFPPPELTYVPEGMSPESLRGWRDAVRRLKPHRYDDAVAYADHELGRLIAALDDLGLRESTVIVITADHGESLGEGGRYLHGFSLHEEQIRIPLIIFLPWMKAPAREDTVVSLIDLGPTLLDIAGIHTPTQFKGHSLLRPESRQQPRSALGARLVSRSGAYEWFVREGPWKLHVIGQRAHLFHVASDPDQQNNLSQEMPIRADYLAHLNWRNTFAFDDQTGKFQGTKGLDQSLSKKERRELKEALQALGYVD
jgi:arylsulfatase A-like enzyme